jgi:uncharacterized Zn-finger protein
MSKRSHLPSQRLALTAFFTGLLFLTGGLIFLCAAVDNAARLPIALVLLLIGGGLVAWAGLRLRRAQQLSPDTLDDRITSLAAAHDAELSLAQVISALDVPDDAARAALARLEADGLCHQERREGRALYVFPGLKEKKVARVCPYCGNEYSVREPLHKCPNCGGNLEIVQS